MSRAAFGKRVIQVQREAREWKEGADGLNRHLQTLLKEREVLHQRVQSLQLHLAELRYNLMCEACGHFSSSSSSWDDFANEDQEGRPRRPQARTWLTRPVRDRRILVQ